MNHLHPPFNNVGVRRAVLMALSQEDYMRALVGDDNNLWKALPGYFTPGTPLYTEEGGEILKGSATSTRRRGCWPRAATANEPVTCIVAQDQPITKTQGDVTADLLKRLGMNVDFVATDWGTTGQRRAMKNPPGQGGWSMFHTWHAGADCVNPAAYIALRAQRRRRLVRLAQHPRGGGRASPSGSTRPTSRRKRRRSPRSTAPRWRTWSTRRPASSWATKPGGATCPASRRGRCPSSGACRRS